jgi:UPF0716 protein FxsA
MLRGLLLLFVVVPLVELYLLTLIAQATSFWVAVLLTVVTGVVGGSLAKREGLKVWRRWQAALANMQVPEDGVVGGLLVLVGGVLLVTPGVLTDIVGFLLLLPPTRRWLSRLIRERVNTRFQGSDAMFSTVAGSGLGLGNQAQRTSQGAQRGSAIDTSGTSIDD